MWSRFLIQLVFFQLADGAYQSFFTFSSFGLEFSPKLNLQLLAFQVQPDVKECSLACHQVLSCRTFDYDSISQRCRLFEADSTTGSIINSSSTTSIVGTVEIDASLYASVHKHPCSTCEEDRYEMCSTTSNMCDCPPHTYWTDSICALQLFENDTCTKADACRSDLNYTCPWNCYGEFDRCIQSFTNYTDPEIPAGYGMTVLGSCDGTNNTNQTLLYGATDVMILSNGSLLVANGDGRLLSFEPGSRTGQNLDVFNNWPSSVYFDKRLNSLYVTVYSQHLVYILPSNKTIPPDRGTSGGCALNRTKNPTATIVDSAGNIYVTSLSCHWVLKWVSNAMAGILVAGLSNGFLGSTADALNQPYGLALDEQNSYLYVTDRYNHRIQRFNLSSGSLNGTTVAGNGTIGVATNQLNAPTEIYLSKIDLSLYIVDSNNNRIQRWALGATSGVTIAGSSSGVSGFTPYLLNYPFALALDESETWLYVSDANNRRVQRFKLI